jgi:putative photosynthetic complex assembly protein 2
MTVAVFFALFVWWFSTGAILWMINRGAGRPDVFVTAPLAGLAAYALLEASAMPGVTGAYLGFASAILVWGWFELAFLTGVITGPNTRPCPPGLRGPRRFLMAWGTLAHHELALLGTAIGIGWATWSAPDQTGLWTFLILFFARISAKLNVYLGVPNLSHEMMPSAIAYMKTYFANRRMNWLFPVSVTLLTLAIYCWIDLAITGANDTTGYVLLTALTVLALIEHWLMVLPVREMALWQWMMKEKTTTPPGTRPADRS